MVSLAGSPSDRTHTGDECGCWNTLEAQLESADSPSVPNTHSSKNTPYPARPALTPHTHTLTLPHTLTLSVMHTHSACKTLPQCSPHSEEGMRKEEIPQRDSSVGLVPAVRDPGLFLRSPPAGTPPAGSHWPVPALWDSWSSLGP